MFLKGPFEYSMQSMLTQVPEGKMKVIKLPFQTRSEAPAVPITY